MLILIDESGDPGFKLDKGSSTILVIAAVMFSDLSEAEKTASELKLLKKELYLPDNREFHFSSTHPKIKEAFFRRAVQNNFIIRAIIFDKTKLYSPNLKSDQERFYNFGIKMLLKNSSCISNASVKLDGRGSREYKKAAKTYLRRELNTFDNQMITKFKFVDSKKDILIQLADMVSGAIYRSYFPDKKDSSLCKEILRPRIKDIWDFK